MRCLAIAQAWQNAEGAATFASSDLPKSLQDRINDEGFHTANITAPAASPADANELLTLAKKLDASAIVVDGYTFGVDYHAAIANAPFTSLAVDDNSHLESYQTDFVLNQNAGVTESLYPEHPSKTEFLLGTQYALLRREFLEASTQSNDKTNTRRILITLGGADPDNATATVVSGLQTLQDKHIEVRVILGSVNPHVAGIEKQIAADGRFQILQNISDMSEQYLWTDLVIAAGGSSNWEMCYFGLPRIVLVVADNQIEIANTLAQKRIAINLGDAQAIHPAEVAKAAACFLNDTSRMNVARQAASTTVDGRGAARCVERLLNPHTIHPDNHVTA